MKIFSLALVWQSQVRFKWGKDSWDPTNEKSLWPPQDPAHIQLRDLTRERLL